MQEFGASVFHTVVHWHKLGEVENKYTLYNYIVLAIFCQKLSMLVEIWQNYDKNYFDWFFETRCSAYTFLQNLLSARIKKEVEVFVITGAHFDWLNRNEIKFSWWHSRRGNNNVCFSADSSLVE